jgi:hypothetical protein
VLGLEHDMGESTLDQVQRLVDQLTPLEQARLLEYLAPRIAQVMASERSASSPSQHSNAEAWSEFFRVGDELASDDSGDGETLTAAVLAMRR